MAPSGRPIQNTFVGAAPRGQKIVSRFCGPHSSVQRGWWAAQRELRLGVITSRSEV
jgi:hypothetical protein